MSLTVALNTAVSGLFANQTAIAATSENIANVNTPNFQRREATFVTDAIPGQFAGVDVEIARAGVDRFLEASLFSGNADAGAADVISDALARIDASLGTPGENQSFANKLDEASAAFALLSADPSSPAARATAIAALEAAFAAFGRTQDAIDLEATAADTALSAKIDRANVLLTEIADLNSQAADSAGAQEAIDTRLSELSTLINISVTRADDGSVSVFTQAGDTLLGAGAQRRLSVQLGDAVSILLQPVDPATGAVNGAAANISATLSGGEIGGLLSLRNQELPAVAALVDQSAQTIADDINAAYSLNTTVGANAPTADPLLVSVSGRIQVNPGIINDPSSLAVARPGIGEVGGAADGSGAAAIADVAIGDAAQNAASVVAQIGAAVRSAEDAALTARSFADDIAARAASDAGVNLDEELSNLILYQRAYNANARVIAAVDELYQSLLNIL
ncbi:MAG: flagellar hook-associated protein FlgK [Pseudomonadota bacterium]